MKTINLIKEYGNRNIEGIDYTDISLAINNASDIFIWRKTTTNPRIIYHSKIDREFYLKCIKEYFIPNKSYIRFSKNERCEFVKNTFGITEIEKEDCKSCFRRCISEGFKIIPKKR